ncbi:MAG: hypothetical protein JXO49_09540 [Deltaproteobacteria bacterium]|nr:hypothetical protein [Candidatus Anaeroferrophillus wilburensis]MBN2889574.1 hypothetical protein [Deltaproteobacteria bacterium]
MSNNILIFSMNRNTSVEKINDQMLESVCRLTDTVTNAEIRIRVKMPDLEISAIDGFFHHTYFEPVDNLQARLQHVVGTRVGAGMLKIIKGLIGSDDNLEQVVYMVEECCHGIILSLTRKVLLKAPDDEPGKVRFYSDMVQNSIRLYDRCAAFAKGGPLVRELEAAAEKTTGAPR